MEPYPTAASVRWIEEVHNINEVATLNWLAELGKVLFRDRNHTDWLTPEEVMRLAESNNVEFKGTKPMFLNWLVWTLMEWARRRTSLRVESTIVLVQRDLQPEGYQVSCRLIQLQPEHIEITFTTPLKTLTSNQSASTQLVEKQQSAAKSDASDSFRAKESNFHNSFIPSTLQKPPVSNKHTNGNMLPPPHFWPDQYAATHLNHGKLSCLVEPTVSQGIDSFSLSSSPSQPTFSRFLSLTPNQ